MILYKYLKTENIENVLKSGYLRFTPPIYFNDPFESLPYIQEVIDKEIVDTLFDIVSHEELFEYFMKTLKNEMIKSTLRNYRDIIEKGKEEADLVYHALLGKNDKDLSSFMQKFWSEKIGILCLSEENDNLTMWSHYAENHCGFVLGFNSDIPITNNEQCLNKPRKVLYSYSRPYLKLFIANMNQQDRKKNWAEKFLYTKSKDWSYENEWRQVNKLESANDTRLLKNEELVHLFKFNKESVCHIYLGCRMNPKDKEEILGHTEDWDISIFQMTISKTNYSLDKIKIK